MRRWFKPGLLALLLLAGASARAEVAYVSEGVSLGVHQQAALTSTILTLLPPGSQMEVLERKNGLVKIRLGDGTEGWVDGRYLTQAAVTTATSDGLEAELVQTAAELARARERASELEFQLNREKERASIMEAELLKARKALENKPANPSGNGSASADALNKLRQASEANRRLKKRVAELEEKLEASASETNEPKIVVVERDPTSDDDASLISRYTAITGWELWKIMLLFFGLLLAFAAGGFLVDWEVRRRHGGFRV